MYTLLGMFQIVCLAEAHSSGHLLQQADLHPEWDSQHEVWQNINPYFSMVLWGIFLYLLLSLVIITSVSRNLHLFLCCYDSFHCMNGGVCHVICLLTGTSGSWTWRGISCRLCLVVPCCSICSTSMSKITSCTPCSGKNTPRISLRYLNLYNLTLYD